MASPDRKASIHTTLEDLSEYRNLVCCLICLDTHRAPKVLQCGHIFCSPCIQGYSQLYGTELDGLRPSFPCPTCRLPTTVPSTGLEGLKFKETKAERSRKISMTAMAIQRCDVCVFQPAIEEAQYYCVKCTMNFCAACKEKHEHQALFRSHSVVHMSNKETVDLYCAAHNKLPSIYFCLDCNLPGCTVCVLTEHHTHHTSKLREALSQRRDNLRILLNSFGPRLNKLDMELRKLVQSFTGQQRKKNGLPSADSPKLLHESNRGSPKSLSKRLESPRNSIIALFTDKKRLSISEGCKGKFSGKSDVNGSSPGQFRGRTNSTPVNPQSLRTNLATTSTESLTAEHQAVIRTFQTHRDRIRKLFDMASKILEMSQSNKLLAVYEDIVDRIQTVLETEIDPLDREIMAANQKEIGASMETFGTKAVSAPNSLDSVCSHRSRVNSTSSGSTAASEGVEDPSGEDDRENQFMLIKPKLVWKIEKQRCDVGELYNPCDVAFLNDHLVVAEYDVVGDKNNQLRILDHEGKTAGVLAAGTIRPLGVAVTREGNLAITDCKDKRVKVMTPAGTVVMEIGKGAFGWAYGIAVNSKGQYIITDAFNDTVSIFAPDGKKISQFGSSGGNSSQFKNPFHVTVDSKDNIFVSDNGNNCVKLFDSSGQFLHKTNEAMRKPSLEFGNERRLKKKRLKGPRGICTDLQGDILVADDCSRVGMFNSVGKYIRNLLTEEDFVKYPEALATSSHGLLAVTEWNPNNMCAVKVFNLYDSSTK